MRPFSISLYSFSRVHPRSTKDSNTIISRTHCILNGGCVTYTNITVCNMVGTNTLQYPEYHVLSLEFAHRNRCNPFLESASALESTNIIL